MPSFSSRILAGALKAVKPLIANVSIEMQRMTQEALSKFATAKLPPGVAVASVVDRQVSMEWFIPDGAIESKASLFFHGGAYVAGSRQSARVLAVDAAFISGVRVLSVEYRLAPEFPFPAALTDAEAAYRYLKASGVAPEDMVFMGDSAGGGLALALAALLKSKGDTLPAAIVCISPWADLTFSGMSHVFNRKNDPTISTESLKQSAAMYAGAEDPANCLISPLFADFSGFPPTLLHVGSREVLLDDSRMLAKKMREAGVDVKLDIWEGMWHVWHVFDLPESKQAMITIGDYVREKLKLEYL